MIDWLTLKVDAMQLHHQALLAFRGRTSRIIRIDPAGVVEWEIVARESIRSDSHQLTVALGSDLTICGSPARVMQASNVFGSGDPVECARAMLAFVRRTVQVELPDYPAWRVTRMDVTCNYDLGGLPQVREALMCLRHAEGGRYQLRTAAESVYWSSASQLRSGKAYAKGPHLEYQKRKGQVELTDQEMAAASRLLRLELSLKSQWWRERAERKWWEYSERELEQEHEAYFAPLIGGAEVIDMENVRQKVVEAAARLGKSEGQGKAAYLYWLTIQQVGFETARAETARNTHYRHVKLLREAGLSFSDFQARRVVALRKRPLVLAQPVRSWDELRAA